ncbi:TonB-dependent siderophore receptor [Altericista sp. CCNU0014]|uniref:TonB-dependent siderophore receptor n=1 Tax=Altericista sp. CCNU0014 TaxID=3082949 RepID=UPI00384CA652
MSKVILQTANILWASSLLLWTGTQPIKAETYPGHKGEIQENLSNPQLRIESIKTLPKASTHAIDLVAQESSSAVKITAVKLKPVPNGIEVILESEGLSASQPIRRTEGNTVVTEIQNAVLALPEGPGFQAANPSMGIASVSVLQMDATTVKVSIVGTVSAPVAATVTLSQPQTAQQPPTQSQTAPSQPIDADEGEEEIVATGEKEPTYRVPNASTATKTDTPLRDIPQSIQVVPRQVIEDQGATRASEILRNVSGVVSNAGPSGVGEEFTIRGFSGNDDVGAGNEYRNGFRALDLGSFNPSNIERVEVLKGPASVLYGQLEPGGVINFVTKQPLDRPYYLAEFEVGSYSFYKPSIDFSGPLTKDKRLLYRLNVAYENSGSFVNFVDREIFQISPSFTYKIGDNTNLKLSYEYLNENGTNNPGLPRNPIAFDLPRNLFLGEPTDTVKNEAQALNLELEHSFNKNWQLRSRVAWQSSSFRRNAHRIRQEPDPITGDLERFFQGDIKNRNESYSVQADIIGKFKTGSIEHQMVFGFEWTRFELLDNTGFATASPINLLNPVYGSVPTLYDDGASAFSSTTDTLGFYLQDQITLLPNLKLLVGGRYEFIDEKSLSQDLDTDGTTPIGEASRNSFSNQAFSPRVGIVYQPIKPVSLYASFSQSFVPNNVFTITRELIQPTRGTQIEAGIKAEFLKGKLAATLSAYQITKTNVAVLDPNDPNEEAFLPVGKVRSRGIEFDLVGEPLPGWNIIASFFVNESIVRVGDPNETPVGDTLTNSPGSGASLWTTYEIQKGAAKGLGFGGGLFYVGDVQAELPNSFVIPSYIRADATIFYKRDNWRIGLNFKNLFNTRYYTSQGAAIYPGEPFTVLGSVGFEF